MTGDLACVLLSNIKRSSVRMVTSIHTDGATLHRDTAKASLVASVPPTFASMVASRNP